MSAELGRRLRSAGWSPGRSVPTHLARLALQGAGHPAWPTALEVVEALEGLRLPWPGGVSARFDAIAAAKAAPEALAALEAHAGGPVCPVAVLEPEGVIAVDVEGMMLAWDGQVHVLGLAFEGW